MDMAIGSSQIEKRCNHDWRFLRTRTEDRIDDTGLRHPPSFTDIFYCTKCLEKREMPG